VAAQGGFSGTSIAVLTVGGLFVYFGINNIPFLEGLREFLRGEPPKPRPTTPAVLPEELALTGNPIVRGGFGTTPGTGTGTGGGTGDATGGAAIVQAARKYLGVPYVWGGHSPRGMDCSGLVTVALKDVGVTGLPSMTHTVTLQFLAWSGAQTVPRDSCRAGDLVCWTGHIGIATDRDNMIHAPTFGQNVQVGKIWNVPAPVIRRVKATASTGKERAA
jgi:cell wall-associated NlpC family hydrolase